jgi:hypothetical protein
MSRIVPAMLLGALAACSHGGGSSQPPPNGPPWSAYLGYWIGLGNSETLSVGTDSTDPSRFIVVARWAEPGTNMPADHPGPMTIDAAGGFHFRSDDGQLLLEGVMFQQSGENRLRGTLTWLAGSHFGEPPMEGAVFGRAHLVTVDGESSWPDLTIGVGKQPTWPVDRSLGRPLAR